MTLASQPHMDLHLLHHVPLRDRKLRLSTYQTRTSIETTLLIVSTNCLFSKHR